MAKRKLQRSSEFRRLLESDEGYLTQFNSLFTGVIGVALAIRLRFAAHTCMHAHRTVADAQSCLAPSSASVFDLT